MIFAMLIDDPTSELFLKNCSTFFKQLFHSLMCMKWLFGSHCKIYETQFVKNA